MTHEPGLYRAHGLMIRSPIELSLSHSRHRVEPDVWVTVARWSEPQPIVGEVVASVARRGGRGYRLYSTRDGWTVDFEGTAAVELDLEARRVSVFAQPHVEEALLSVLISGPVMAVVSAARRRPLVHASAIAGEHGAVTFFGPSGSGKSTLALLSVELGLGSLLSDDGVLMEVAEMRTLVHGGTRASRLRAPVPDAGRSGDGRWIVVAGPEAPATAALRCAVQPVLEARGGGIELTRLDAATALVTLASCPVLENATNGVLLGSYFQRCAAAVSTGLPVLRAEMPWPPGTEDRLEVVGQLYRQLSDAGLDLGESS